MLVENINYLRKNYRYIRDLLSQFEEQLKEQPVQVEQSKTGLPSLSITMNGRPLSVHSKYDPLKEAEKLVDQYEEKMGKYDHIFFYGAGFGYHIEAFMERYPDKKFSIYEPSPAIFYHYLCQRQLEKLPVKQLKNLFVEWTQESGSQFISQFAHDLQDNVLLVILPSYSRIFPSELEQFTTTFKHKVQEKRYSFGADYSFAKRWTLNSLMNLPTTLETPNLLMDKRDVFRNKPVLIVSAGPSLQDEYDNLRQIKENGSAYILAVGSANKALIANDILPDAVCTYDPQEHNSYVFQSMIENNITSVPMIYGTSVGYETIQRYRGPKLHVVTSQDTVTPYYINYGDVQLDFVNDAFSIAIVMLQVLMKMNAGPIILVGQNFAFRDNQYYSKEIVRGEKQTAEVEEKDLEDVLTVKDVYGNEIRTNVSFNQMRLMLEQYIQANNQFEVINTTKGGAAITGAPFQPLEEVIEKRLTKNVVEANWYEASTIRSTEQTKQRLKKMQQAIEEFPLRYEDVFTVLREMEATREAKNTRKLETLFTKFDKAFKQFINNDCFDIYLRPVSRVEYENVSKKSAKLRSIVDPLQKAKEIIQTFGLYMHMCREYFNDLVPAIQLASHPQLVKKQRSFSNCNIGVFKYMGSWDKQEFNIEKPTIEQTELIGSYRYTTERGAKIRFKFKGTSLMLFGAKRQDLSTEVRITINGKGEKFSTRDFKKSTQFTFTESVVFQKHRLPNTVHDVEIELLDEKMFIFFGVETDGRLFHVDEVTTVEELEIGKRIRCHYKASFNQVGVFSGLGEATKDFIPPESSAYPDGDFYFIMVDETEGEGKKLIADRNVQHSISWVTLNNNDLVFGKSIDINSIKVRISLLTGGNQYRDEPIGFEMKNYDLGGLPATNEWDKYVGVQKETEWNFEKIVSWTSDRPISGLKHPVNALKGEIDHKKCVVARGGRRGYLTFQYEDSVYSNWGYRPVIDCLVVKSD